MKRGIILVGIVILIIIIFLLGLDEIVINSTINLPKIKCTTSSDCTEYDTVSKGCFNKNWNPYESVVKRVFGSIILPIGWYCTCDNNKCKTNYLYQGEINGSIEDCGRIKNLDVKDICLLSYAKAERRIEICSMIMGKTKRGECFFYNRLKANSENCEEISDVKLKKWCIAIVKNDTSICEEINEKFCYRDIAIAMKDSLICEKINGSYNRQTCYSDVAIATNNISLCEFIYDTRINVCYDEVNKNLALETGNASFCEDDILCYSSLVRTNNNTNLCDSIASQNNKEICIRYLAMARKDYILCESIVDSNNKDLCYIYVGEESKDINICNKIVNIEKKEDCKKYVNSAS
jgi:hypothetical protein